MRSWFCGRESRKCSHICFLKVVPGDGDDDDKGHCLVSVEKLESHRIMSIGINRPEKRNCVDFATADELAEAFEDFEHDEVTPSFFVNEI